MSLTTASLGRQQYIADMTSPQIRPAGLSSNINESAKDALTWGARPATPEDQKKYRALSVHEPGKIVKHWGMADDPIPPGPYGDATKSKPGESVAENMKGNFPNTEMGRWQLEQAEAIYASSNKEPLGRGYQRGHQIPADLGTTRPFGMTIDAIGKEREGQARRIMFPTDQPPPDDEEGSKAHELYVRSHAAYLPGEQRRRHYEWDKTQVDPTTFRFGAVDKDDIRDGVRKALQPGLDQGAVQPSRVATKIHEDHKQGVVDRLGAVRQLGTGERQLSPDHTFGMPSLRKGVREPGVDALMKFGYPTEQQQPDADLGKSLREGWRNIAPEGRTFGVPSIRTDIPMPTKRSCASTANYGNEPDALQLLRPPKSVERGINESHYIQLRTKEEVHDIMAEAEIGLDEDQFEAVWGMAVQADGEVEHDKCCLDTFFRARHHVLNKTLQL